MQSWLFTLAYNLGNFVRLNAMASRCALGSSPAEGEIR